MKRPPLTVIVFAALHAFLVARDTFLLFRGQYPGIGGGEVLTWVSPLIGLATLCGVWLMRRWAVAFVLVSQLVTAAYWSLTPTLWREKYPLLGPTVPWIWLVIWAALLLPHWRKMSWRFP